MKKLLIILIFCLLNYPAWALEHQIIDTLGSSSKGQFVALEEYGYKFQTHTYYVRVKIMNVWKKQYVGKSIEVELPAHRPNFLEKARIRARVLANEELKKFQIKI
jgi:predicted secreted protein